MVEYIVMSSAKSFQLQETESSILSLGHKPDIDLRRTITMTANTKTATNIQ